MVSESLTRFDTCPRLVDLPLNTLNMYLSNIYSGDKEGVTNACFCFLSACFLLMSLTSSASGSPGKHDLYAVGGYCISTSVCNSVTIPLRSMNV